MTCGDNCTPLGSACCSNGRYCVTGATCSANVGYCNNCPTLCSGKCANLNSDNHNCGGCGTSCTVTGPSWDYCERGACKHECYPGAGWCGSMRIPKHGQQLWLLWQQMQFSFDLFRRKLPVFRQPDKLRNLLIPKLPRSLLGQQQLRVLRQQMQIRPICKSLILQLDQISLLIHSHCSAPMDNVTARADSSIATEAAST